MLYENIPSKKKQSLKSVLIDNFDQCFFYSPWNLFVPVKLYEKMPDIARETFLNFGQKNARETSKNARVKILEKFCPWNRKNARVKFRKFARETSKMPVTILHFPPEIKHEKRTKIAENLFSTLGDVNFFLFSCQKLTRYEYAGWNRRNRKSQLIKREKNA